jgi:hypothetical protein
MQPTNSSNREIRRQQARAVIVALVNLGIVGLLSLYIPYAAIAAGIIFIMIGVLMLLWDQDATLRTSGWLYLAGGGLLGLLGLYLAAEYLQLF